MEQGHILYVIGVGDFEDWQAGGGSIYYIEDRKGERALPVFSTPEGANQYRRANFGTPRPPLDILKSVRREHVRPLSEGRFIVMPLDAEGLARAATAVGADYAILDPRPGDEQEILRLT